MYFKSKPTSLIMLGVTALICSRAMFALFKDPEGPNLLIVVVMAAILWFLSLTVYRFKTAALTALNRLLLAIGVQLLIAAGFYFGLN